MSAAGAAPDARSPAMWIVLAILLFLLFGGLGFVIHLLWTGLLLVAIALVINAMLKNRNRV